MSPCHVAMAVGSQEINYEKILIGTLRHAKHGVMDSLIQMYLDVDVNDKKHKYEEHIFGSCEREGFFYQIKSSLFREVKCMVQNDECVIVL